MDIYIYTYIYIWIYTYIYKKRLTVHLSKRVVFSAPFADPKTNGKSTSGNDGPRPSKMTPMGAKATPKSTRYLFR